MSCALKDLEQIDDRTLDLLILRAIRKDDGAAAKAHLQAGRPVYYCMDDFDAEIVREWPDGTRELVVLDDEGVVTCVACVIPRM